MNLTTLLSLWPAAPVKMAGPSPSQLDQLKQQLDRVTRLAGEELCKGARRDEDLVTQLQMQAETLTAQIKLIPSGESHQVRTR